LGLAGRKRLTFLLLRPHHHRRPPMAANLLLTSTRIPHRLCTSMHRPHRSATGRQQLRSRRRSTIPTIHDLFIGPGRADTERTGLMRGEATLFMGVVGGITADIRASRGARSGGHSRAAPAAFRNRYRRQGRGVVASRGAPSFASSIDCAGRASEVDELCGRSRSLASGDEGHQETARASGPRVTYPMPPKQPPRLRGRP
jgi:hypothetical protein